MKIGPVSDDASLEPFNEKIRGAEVEEILTNGERGLVLSFRGNVPDLFLDVDFEYPEEVAVRLRFEE